MSNSESILRSRRQALSFLVLAPTLLAGAGCTKGDLREENASLKGMLEGAQTEILRLSAELRLHREKERAEREGLITKEWHLSPSTVLSLQQDVIDRMAPGIKLDPVLTEEQHDENSAYFNTHCKISVVLRLEPRSVTSAALHMSTGRGVCDKKGREQSYDFDIELKKDKDGEMKLFIRNAQISLEGSGDIGYARLPESIRGITAKKLRDLPQLSALYPLVRCLAEKAQSAGMEGVAPFAALATDKWNTNTNGNVIPTRNIGGVIKPRKNGQPAGTTP